MKTKILVVDDEADLELLIQQKFRRKIRDGAYEFVFAGNGREALDRLTEHADIDVVLSDINMPVMDGLTLLGEVHTRHPLLRMVMVSAYGDMANIRTAMNRGAFDFVVKPVDFTDLELTIDKTGAQVRELRLNVRARRENHRLKMYVDEAALGLLDRPGAADDELLLSEMVDATVAFFDICGFTSLSETLPPAAVVGLLNAYFDEMARGITTHGGTIDKFMGDAVMAVFRGPDHLPRAVRAALDVRARLQAAPPTLPPGLTQQPAVAIGLNAGEMVSGNIGSVTLHRLDYTVIGDAVNLSQRLQSVAQPGQILIAEATFALLNGAFECRPLGEVRLKNKARPVPTYEVVG
ncbi:MAG: response regulator [Hymenobacteraceae bacterium]|nr:response regulator [Hymenobacteraceae bacterium]